MEHPLGFFPEFSGSLKTPFLYHLKEITHYNLIRQCLQYFHWILYSSQMETF